MELADIAFYLGDDATKKAVELRITERLKPLARLQRHARETKNNPQFVDVTVTYKNYECQNYSFFPYDADLLFDTSSLFYLIMSFVNHHHRNGSIDGRRGHPKHS
jgi:hypothetical protein